MARGWESKSVEAQIECAESRRGGTAMQLTPDQTQTIMKRDSLLLHRKRVLNDLERCTEDRYRKTLNDGLAYLEAQLSQMGWQAS